MKALSFALSLLLVTVAATSGSDPASATRYKTEYEHGGKWYKYRIKKRKIRHYKRKHYHRPHVYRYSRPHHAHYRPDWIPAWCGKCGTVRKMKHLSTQVKVKTHNGLVMLFDYNQGHPPPSMDGRNWACTNFDLQMVPFFHIWKGTCAFKARPVTIQPVEPPYKTHSRPLIRGMH